MKWYQSVYLKLQFFGDEFDPFKLLKYGYGLLLTIICIFETTLARVGSAIHSVQEIASLC